MNRLVGQGRYFESTNPKFEEIKVLLDNAGNKEKMEGMKRLLAVRAPPQQISLFNALHSLLLSLSTTSSVFLQSHSLQSHSLQSPCR